MEPQAAVTAPTPTPASSPAPKVGKFKAGWLVLKESSKVLSQDKELMALPVRSFFIGLATSLILVVIGWFVYGAVKGTQYANIALYALLFIDYLVSYFVVTYYGCALAAAAIYRFQGHDPDVNYGISQARRRIKAILAFAAISATVGVILRIIRDNDNNWLGAIIASILGAAWSIVTLFVRPVIVMTELGPIETIKESARTFRKAWGADFVGSVSMSLIGFGLTLLSLIPVTAGIFLFSQGVFYLVGGGLISLILITALWIWLSTLTSIFNAALYLYATTGQVPQAFSQELVKGAFVPKR